MGSKGKKLKWHLLIVLLLTAVVIQTPFYLLNQGRVQRWILNTYRPFSPWQIEIGSLKANPWRLKIDVENARLFHPQGHEISVKSVSLAVGFLRLLRGQLGIRSLEIDGPVVTIAETHEGREKKEKKKFKIRTLLLIQNLAVNKGAIQNAIVNLPGEKQLSVDAFGIDLVPELRGGTKLSLDLKNVLFRNAEGEEAASQHIKTDVTTNFTHWTKTAPYIDDVEGNLLMRETRLGRLRLKEVEARIRFDDNRLISKKLLLQIGENQVVGNMAVQLDRENFLFNLKTPKPVVLPELGGEKRTFNTAGALQTSIHMEGTGFRLKQSRGNGEVALSHIFENTEDPVRLDSRFTWQNGTVSLQETQLRMDKGAVHVNGGIDLAPPALHLKMKGENLPMEGFFAVFEDTNLHPIRGRADVEASLEGIGKTIHLQLKGTVAGGGYGFLNAEKTNADLEITHEGLKLNGRILTDEKTTIHADFNIDYGPESRETGMRSKKITLSTTFNNHPLEKTFPDGVVRGDVSGTFHLTGPAQNIKGEGDLKIMQGSVIGGGFEELQTRFTLTSRGLVIDKADFLFFDGDAHLLKPVVFDFLADGNFRVAGQPFTGVHFEIFHHAPGKRWEIRDFVIEDLSNPDLKMRISGFASPERFDIRVKGDLELSRLQFFGQHVREAAGPASFDLALQGSPADPTLSGSLSLKNVTLSLRPLAVSPEELTGTIRFQGKRIHTDLLSGLLGSGAFQLKGGITHDKGKIASYDLSLEGKQLYLHDPESGFRMEYDADVTFKGPARSPELSGNIAILDGRYTKNFNIIEELKEAPRAHRLIRQAALDEFPVHFNLRVRNFGDLLIVNNIGQMELAVDITLKGTRFNPVVNGTVTTKEGRIRYLGLDFEITRGFAEFRGILDDPYLEVRGEKEMDSANIVATLRGHTSNLRMDLAGDSSTGPLERKDVVSLILFGMTTGERTALAQDQPEIGTAMVAEQITHILQRPVASLTGLDIIRMETQTTQDGKTRQFYLGKRLNDRLSVEFASEINQYNDALQRFRLEYLLTDSIIFKGSRASNESYQLNLGLRFTDR